MNKIIFIVGICVFVTTCEAQALKYQDTQNLRDLVNIKNGDKYKEYYTKSGDTIKIGDIIKVGKPVYGKMYKTIAHEKLSAFDIIFGSVDYVSILYDLKETVITDIFAIHDKVDREGKIRIIVIVKRQNKKSFKTIIDFENAIERGEIII